MSSSPGAGPSSITPSLHALRSHSIFIPPASASTSQKADEDDEWEIVDDPREPIVSQKQKRVVSRGEELIVNYGREIRITSLGKDRWPLRDGRLGSYKVLKTPHVTFEVKQVSLNPTGRLLAVVGKNQLVVVALPKSVDYTTDGEDLLCKSFPIDEFQFSATSSAVITQVAWHPWGEDGTSLWVLTSDGKLREYDVSRPDDPTQTFTFLPPQPGTTSHSRFSAVDPLSRYATSFTFYPGTTGDFGEAMVYVMTANGDLYFMGPILPLRSQVPLEWLQRIKLLSDGHGGAVSRWVSHLVHQVNRQNMGRASTNTTQDSPTRPQTRREGSVFATSEEEVKARESYVRVHPPHLTASGGPAPGEHRPLLRQGPIVFSPGPAIDDEDPDGDGDGDEDEDVASDLALISLEDCDSVVTLGIAWSRGRVDLGIIVDPPEPRWVTSREPSNTSPTVPIVESIQLATAEARSQRLTNAPFIMLDSSIDSTLLVINAFGVDAINLQSLSTLFAGESEGQTCGTRRLVNSSSSEDTILVGATTFWDIGMGHSLLALSSSGRVATVELDDQGSSPDPTTNPSQPLGPNLSTSSPESGPFDYEALSRSIATPQNLSTALSSISHNQPIANVSSEQLRQFGSLVSQLQAQTQAVRTASQALETRLDDMIRESQRQVRLLKNCRDDIENMRDTKSGPKLVRLIDVHAEIADRLEELLNRARGIRDSSAGGSEELSEQEKAWLDRLNDAKVKVEGHQGKGAMLQGEVMALKLQKEGEGMTKDQPNGAGGKGEMDGLQDDIRRGAEEIRRLMRQMDALNVKVETVMEGRL